MIENTYPGQIWTADDQCKMMLGNQAFFCVKLFIYDKSIFGD
jgi:hypothetical protein